MNDSIRKLIKEQMDTIKKDANIRNEGIMKAYGFSQGANWMYELLAEYAKLHKVKSKEVEQ